IQSTEEQIVQVEVFDINGKSLYKTNSNTIEVRIPAQHWKKQILIVNAETESGEVISKKLIN
ncbi:MAG: T9SS sorting signal type C domain-containing protein, partial [Weeksellaceae bacterium]|nr:T9SS sorting signal type C domain-containing protein [Weeksellaceae bacterium]